ncbi:hypothetical protein FZEAL_6930 [Fusarium zealandicum]|uniref:RRM domain-containing protein n=1 Tax=Fusarium zealandicum TaxID=1053134 RepID=A0A8H4UHT5_9HYPO|nr:hypothetical protein FZEAL_6930 [Fusarium zealandicum]
MDPNASYPSNQPERRPQSHLTIPGSSDPNGIMHQFQGMSLGGIGMAAHPAPLHMASPYVVPSDGHFVLAPMQGSQTLSMNHAQESGYGNYPVNSGYGGHYMSMPSFQLGPYTPGRVPGHARVDRTQSEVPGLENRRGSYSTTESAPATPFYSNFPQRENGPRVASLDRSAYTTPSPQQLGLGPSHADVSVKSKHSHVPDHILDELLEKNPAVPKAVPAVFTPAGQMKSLEQSLENRIPGNRNVYIRGLHPTTDDELLYHYAARFGAVETSKAIIDTGTGACKGFGFAKFFNIADSEMCIRGFHHLGYEVGFARAEGDEDSTNLYISNLPKSLTEVELATIFLGFTILSSKILRDSMGNSRGVGFARFESRDVCDKVIHTFHGASIGEEGLLMNIRYADTAAQKELKRVTAERRQFRTNEYNIGAYGTPLVGLSAPMYPYQAQYRQPLALRPRNGASSSGTVSDGSNVIRRSASQNPFTETAASSSMEEAVTTPTSSECDENVTIHADTAVAHASFDSSPSVKRDAKKDTKEPKDTKKDAQ